MTDTLTVFEGPRRLVSGERAEVAAAMRGALRADPNASLTVFDDETGRSIDIDLRKETPQVRGRGRPRLGVTAREVTLLPRHWEWLAAQPGGASVVLRRLVEQARKDPALDRKARQSRAYSFCSAMAGNEAGFEEAMRALFADDRAGFDGHCKGWPDDIRKHARTLAFGEG